MFSIFGKITYRTVYWKKLIDFGYERMFYGFAPDVNEVKLLQKTKFSVGSK